MRRPLRDALAIAILVFLTLGIGVLDCVAGRNVSLWFLYVLPIASAAAIGGARVGIPFAILSAGLLFASGSRTGHPFPAAGYFYFELFGDFFVYLVIVALSLGLRERFRKGIGELLPSAAETEALKRTVAAQHDGSKAA